MRSVMVCACLAVSVSLVAQQVSYSIDEARALMAGNNVALKVADAGVQMARRERQRVNALWWPQVQAEGAYVHLSEKVEVRQPLSYYTDPAKEYVQHILPGDELVTGLLDKVGQYSLTFPLLPQDLASVGLTAEWVAFSGGRRYYADKVARNMVYIAQLASARVGADEEVLLVERYYGLVLARHTTDVCRVRYEAMSRHYGEALRMERVGMADKAVRLLAQVAMEEAEREWHHAESVEQVCQTALKQVLGIADAVELIPTSPLSTPMEIPSEVSFQEAMRSGNYTLGTLSLEEQMAGDKLRIDLGGYLPSVSLFGKQTLYAHGLPSNLFPRTVVGVGFAWNLFDGLERERKVALSRLARQSLAWTREDAEAELAVAVSELYATLQRTMAGIRVLDTTIALNEELLRMRRVAFAEGMATMTELVDAENALATSRLAHLTAQYTVHVTMATLQAVCGR